MNPHFHTDFSISDSLIFVRKSVLIYETIIEFIRSTIIENGLMLLAGSGGEEDGEEDGEDGL